MNDITGNTAAGPPLVEFLDEMLRYGLALSERSHPIFPVVAVRRGGEVEMNVMTDFGGENHLAVAEQFIAEVPPEVQMYALIRATTIRLNGMESCAVVVDVEERGMPRSLRNTQPFAPKRFLKGFKVLGPPSPATQGPKRFR